MLGLIFSLLLAAALLGVIIVGMEEGEFPGWWSLLACVFAAFVPSALINALLPPSFFMVGLAVGAVCAGFAISAVCGMSVKRATIAAAIFLVSWLCLSLLLAWLFSY